MPSPFPGMDPFLEHPAYFGGLHTCLMVEITSALQPALPDHYFADVEVRRWLEPARGPTHPDDEHRQCFVEMRTRHGHKERVVATIGMMTPGNKTVGDQSRKLFLSRQKDVLNAATSHLIEIDLLRGGRHATIAIEELLPSQAGPFDYHVCVRRFDQPGKLQIYAFELPDCLPRIGVPLLPGDGEVPLDLQAVFNRCYDMGPYRKRVHYTLDRIDPPLVRKRVAWAQQILNGISVKRE
jgi:hypothetical protein